MTPSFAQRSLLLSAILATSVSVVPAAKDESSSATGNDVRGGCSPSTTGSGWMKASVASQSLGGQVFVITGANGAMASHVTKAVVSAGGTAVMLCRSTAKCAASKEAIQQELGDGVDDLMDTTISMDLSMPSVKAAAAAILAKYDTISVLFQIAGLRGMPAMAKKVTLDGYQVAMEANILAPALFSDLLLPALRNSFEKTGSFGRVVNVGSFNAYDFGTDRLPSPAAMMHMTKRPPAQSFNYYSLSKFLTIYHAKHFAQQHREDGVLAFSVNPGFSRDDQFGCLEYSGDDQSKKCDRNTEAVCKTWMPDFHPCPQSSDQSSTGILFAAFDDSIIADNGALFDYDSNQDGQQFGDSCVSRQLPYWTDDKASEWFALMAAELKKWQ